MPLVNDQVLEFGDLPGGGDELAGDGALLEELLLLLQGELGLAAQDVLGRADWVVRGVAGAVGASHLCLGGVECWD